MQAGSTALVRLERSEKEARISNSPDDNSGDAFGLNKSIFVRATQFIYDELTEWAEHHAITITIPNKMTGPRIVLQDGDKIRETDELTQKDELKGKSHGKKKWAVLFPLMALLKFFMLKSLLVPIFMATMITKKLALMAFFYIPPWFASLKICKKEPVVHYHHKSAYDHDEYAAGEYEPTGYQYTGYGRDWSRRHRRLYYP